MSDIFIKHLDEWVFQFHSVVSSCKIVIDTNINSNAVLKKYQVKHYNAKWVFNWSLIISSHKETRMMFLMSTESKVPFACGRWEFAPAIFLRIGWT